MSTKRHFVVVLPGNVRVFKDLEGQETRGWTDKDRVRQMAQEVVYAAKLTTPRKRPTDIVVPVFEQTIKEGKIVETLFGQFDISLPLEPMSGEEYMQERTEAMAVLPVEFRNFVISQVTDYDSSYEEKMNLAREMADGLAKAIAAYTNRITNQK